MYFSRVFLECRDSCQLEQLEISSKGGEYALLQHCVRIQFYSNTNSTNIVAEWSESIAFGSRHSELAAKIQARLTPDCYIIAESMLIAESEGRCSNSNCQSVPILLLHLLGIRSFCFEFCRRSCVTVSFWFTLGISVIGEAGSGFWSSGSNRASSCTRTEQIIFSAEINKAVAAMTGSKSQIISRTYRFDVLVYTGPLSSQDDVCGSFKEILRAADARIKISGRENCFFSFDVPDEGFVKISGYLHVDKASRLYETTVRTWILDERII